MDVSKCSQCDCGKERPIVNKYFKLCNEKNQERLQVQKVQVQGDGKSKRKDNWKERSDFRIKRKTKIKSKGGVRKHSRLSVLHSKRSKQTYGCTNGERVTQAEVEIRYKETCQQIDREREQFCEATGRTDLPLSHSHTISRARCKAIGKTELIWDKNNLFIESMGASDSGHVIWEHGDLESKKRLLNFDKKLEYIKKHDNELYQKFVS